MRVGRLVPLMATLVTLNQLNFWMTAYAVRNTLPLTYLTLVGLVVIVGGYYLFSSLVFPDDPAEWPDFDAYYDQHNRFILIGMLVINLFVGLAAGRYMPARSAAQNALFEGPLGLALIGGVWGGALLMIAPIVARGRRLNAVLLALLIAIDLGMAVGVAVLGAQAP